MDPVQSCGPAAATRGSVLRSHSVWCDGLIQLGAGAYAPRRRSFTDGQTALSFDEYFAAVEMTVSRDSAFATVAMLLRGSPEATQNGTLVAPLCPFVLDSERGGIIVVPGPCRIVALSIGRRLRDSYPTYRVHRWTSVNRSSVALRRFLEKAAAFAAHDGAAEAATKEMAKLLAGAWSVVPSIRTIRERSCASVATRRLDRVLAARRFMHANIGEELKLGVISEAVRVSLRTLAYDFQDVVGMSPKAYLKAIRLDAVRNELARGDGRESVYDVAARFGFWHAGHFRADYQKMFGSSPQYQRGAKPSSYPANGGYKQWMPDTALG